MVTVAPSKNAGGRAYRAPTGTRLALNTVSNFIGQAIVLFVTFFSTPYVTHKLGAAQYGTLSLLIVCVFSVSLLNLGINTSLIKYLAELMPRGDIEGVQEYFSTGLTTLGGLGLVVGVLIFFAAEPIVTYFFRDAGQFTSAIHISVRIASFALVLQFLTQVLVSIAASLHRFEILSVVGTASETARLVGMIVIVFCGGQLVALMTWMVVVGFCTCLTYGIIARKLVPGLQLKPTFSAQRFRSLVNHSKFVVVGNTSRQLVGSADNALIGYFLPVANLAYYGIAYSVAQRLWTLVGNVASVVFPAASAFAGTQQTENMRDLYLRSTKIAAATACFPAFAIAIFSREFMLYWLSPEYSSNGALVLACLSIGFLLNSFSFVPFQTLQSTFYAAATAKASLVYAAINLAMFILLIPRYGIVGAGVAFVISQFVYVPWFTRMANHRLGVSHWAVIQGYGRVGLVATVACGIAWIFRFAVHSLLSLALVVISGLIVYLFLGYKLILDGRERTAASSILRQLFAPEAKNAGSLNNASSN